MCASQSLLQDRGDFVVRQHDGIGFHAAAPTVRDNPCEVSCLDAEPAEPRNIQLPDPVFEQIDQGFMRFLRIGKPRVAQQTGQPGIFVQGGVLRFARLHGLDVHPGSGGHQGAADHAVRNREESPQRRGEAMDGTQTGLRQGDTREQGGIGHTRTRVARLCGILI